MLLSSLVAVILAVVVAINNITSTKNMNPYTKTT